MTSQRAVCLKCAKTKKALYFSHFWIFYRRFKSLLCLGDYVSVFPFLDWELKVAYLIFLHYILCLFITLRLELSVAGSCP